MTWGVGWLSIFLFLTWTTLAASSPQEAIPGRLFIQRQGERLTIDARRVPHQRLLETMAQWFDFELILKGSLPQPRSLIIEGRPWEQALKQVLSPASWAFRYTRTSGGDRLVQVTVFPAQPGSEAEQHAGRGSRASEQPPLTSMGPLEVWSADPTNQGESSGEEGPEAAGRNTQDAQSGPQQDSEEALQK